MWLIMIKPDWGRDPWAMLGSKEDPETPLWSGTSAGAVMTQCCISRGVGSSTCSSKMCSAETWTLEDVQTMSNCPVYHKEPLPEGEHVNTLRLTVVLIFKCGNICHILMMMFPPHFYHLIPLIIHKCLIHHRLNWKVNFFYGLCLRNLMNFHWSFHL